nr:caspase family protein [Amylibacter sp.]
MKPKFPVFLLLLHIFLLVVSASIGTAKPRLNRVALIIGNSTYLHISNLRTPSSDSSAIAAQFQRLGYQTILLQNLTRKQLLIALAELQISAVNSDQVVVYYAGHGMQHNGESYLTPTDALASNELMTAHLIPMRVVIRAISDKPRQKLVFFDACRDGVLLGKPASGKNSTSWAHAGLFILYSTQPDTTASDGMNYLSPFAHAMTQALEKPPMPIEEFAKRVRLDVIRETNGAQIPWSQSSLLRPAILSVE